MGDTEFLRTLHPASQCPNQANKLASRFMRTKGYTDARPIGVFVDGSLLYYYYRMPEGVLELEVSEDKGTWQRRVSDFITRPDEVEDMLGAEPVIEAAQPTPAPGVMFQAPQV